MIMNNLPQRVSRLTNQPMHVGVFIECRDDVLKRWSHGHAALTPL